tara:strand:- start:357 stop:1709 length:1353 start_codon:yes stop_codon:yes gene_type:complete
MATTTVSIGSNQSIDTAVPASSSADGSDWVITWNKTLSASVSVGDLATATDHDDGAFVYLIIAISGSNYTLKYISGTGGNQSPYALCTDSYCSAPPTFTFKRAFSTITLFEAMVDDSSPSYWGSSDDVIGELHADSNFTDATVNFSDKQSLSSVTLSVYEGDRHNGTAESGALWKPTTNSGHDQGILRINIDSMTAEWLDISFDSLDSKNTNKAIVLVGTNNNNIIRNNLIHDKNGNPGNNGPFMIHTLAAGASSDSLYIFNNIIYNIVETSNDSASAVNINAWAGNAYIYNNTVYNIQGQGGSKHGIGFRFGNPSSANVRIKNNIASKCEGGNDRAYWKNSSGSTVDSANNLSDDTTNATYDAEDMGQSLNDSSALTGKTLAEIAFVSTSAGAEDLHIKRSSVCNRAGVSLGSTNKVNIDIDGETIFNNWAIGADFIADGPTFLFSMLT